MVVLRQTLISSSAFIASAHPWFIGADTLLDSPSVSSVSHYDCCGPLEDVRVADIFNAVVIEPLTAGLFSALPASS